MHAAYTSEFTLYQIEYFESALWLGMKQNHDHPCGFYFIFAPLNQIQNCLFKILCTENVLVNV